MPVLLAGGVALATAISFARVLAIAGALEPALLPLLGPPLGAAALTAAGFAALAAYWRVGEDGHTDSTTFRNPFNFWSVVGFAILLAAVTVAGRAVGEHLGAAGAVVGAAAMGLADVDAITVAMARLVPQPLSAQAATYAILAAVASNTLSKLAIGAGIGRGRFAVEVTVMSLACALAAGAALWAAVIVAD